MSKLNPTQALMMNILQAARLRLVAPNPRWQKKLVHNKAWPGRRVVHLFPVIPSISLQSWDLAPGEERVESYSLDPLEIKAALVDTRIHEKPSLLLFVEIWARPSGPHGNGKEANQTIAGNGHKRGCFGGVAIPI